MQLGDALFTDASLSPGTRAAIAEKFALADKRLIDGADEELQLIDLMQAAHRAVQATPIAADKERIIIM